MVSRHQPFNRDLAALPWRDDREGLDAWQQGRTGIPIIDAAMRQLNQTSTIVAIVTLFSVAFGGAV